MASLILHLIAEQILSLYTKEKKEDKIFPNTMSRMKLSTDLKAVGLSCSIRNQRVITLEDITSAH